MNKIEELQVIETESKTLFTNWCKAKSWCTINRWSKNEFANWDVSFFSANTAGQQINLLGELKYRFNDNVSKYDNWMLIKAKNDSLQSLANETNSLPIYINITKDKQIMLWNLKEIIPNKLPIKKMLKDSTNMRNGDFYREKEIYWLNKKETIINEQIN